MKLGAVEVHKFAGGDRRKLGYARVSRQDQNLRGQLDILERAGVSVVVAEKVSSVGVRPGWAQVVGMLRPGDLLLVTRLDRIGRRLSEIVTCVHELTEEGIHVCALQQGVDTSAQGGKIVLALWAALAETERETLRERTREGMAAAKARGRKAGRPVVLDAAKRDMIEHLRSQEYSIKAIAKAVKLGKSTVGRAVQEMTRRDPRQLKLLDAPAADEAKKPTKPKAPAPAVVARKKSKRTR